MLVHRGPAADDRVFCNSDMTGEEHVVDEDYVVSERAIVGNVRPNHEQASIADTGQKAAAGRPGVDCDVLTDPAVATDLQPARLASILQILRCKAEARERIHLGVLADLRRAADDDMGMKANARLQHNAGSH